MPHESTVNPYDYMGETMGHDIINRMSRGSSILNVDVTSQPGFDVTKLAQEASVKLADLVEQKIPQAIDHRLHASSGDVIIGSAALEQTDNHTSLSKRDSVNSEQLVKPETPSQLTHYEEFDDDDEESDESKSSVKDN